MIKSENARLTGWVFVDIAGRDIAGFVEEAKRAIANQVDLPSGYSLGWSGQYEYLQRAEERLRVVVPFTLIIIALLLYLNFRNLTEVAIIMLSLPFALVGGICYLYLLGYHLSVAIGVGFIALAGVAAETGVVMLVFLNQAYRRKLANAEHRNQSMTESELKEAVIEGALLRVRPLIMTVSAIIAGLVPIMFGTGTGSEVMQRIAAPMFGGMITATVLTLIVIPAIYYLWRKRSVN
jgi:Cu(I)/Ag(I) efflux system membrane protein CusA/SilA